MNLNPDAVIENGAATVIAVVPAGPAASQLQFAIVTLALDTMI
uniref:Unannotated protein n=1 Tax=freshwater metagenome TaxID=449393 RepID=A0A6J6A1P7_9ZZZZ